MGLRAFRREFGWGDTLRLEAAKKGGLAKAVRCIHAVLGASMPTRNTFDKLFDRMEPPTDPRERQRAFVLVLALDGDPAMFDLDDVTLPTAWPDAKSLRDLLRQASTWIADLAA